ncbi:MAG: hypothetical protein JEZ07_02185 [Phycisphaerae bacterium]|nr:hypothetical protein [Phycisphaerae bacterium]
MNPLDKHKLNELLLLLIDGQLTDEQFVELEKHFTDRPETLDYYYEFIRVQMALQNDDMVPIAMPSPSSIVLDQQSKILPEIIEADYEAIEKQNLAEIEPKQTKSGSTYHRAVPSYTSLFKAVGSIAAMVFVALMLSSLQNYYARQKHHINTNQLQPVATVTELMDTQWASDRQVAIGNIIYPDSMELKQGYIGIELKNGAKVTIEAPAKFSIDDSETMTLLYGKVYACVPKKAIGFTIDTNYSRVIDLGTEFGLEVMGNGDQNLHIYKGKASLMAGKSLANKTSNIIEAGQSRKYDATTDRVSDIAFEKNKFVRHISSAYKIVWRGQGLSLADMVGGGDGMTGGKSKAGILAGNGQICLDVYKAIGQIRSEDLCGNQYNSVDMKYVDGVFVPQGQIEKLQVSSLGHTFNQAIEANGTYICKGIINLCGTGSNLEGGWVLNGIEYGIEGNPAIIMHRNKGITFDLDEIRQDYPDRKIVGFTSVCGLSEIIQNFPKDAISANFYVLVDGQVRFEYNHAIATTGGIPIEIELNPDDRFITLITAYDSIGMRNLSLFGNPTLQLD